MTEDALGRTRRWPAVRQPTPCVAIRCASMCCLRLFRRKRVRARRHPRCESGRLPVRPRARAGEVSSARSNSVTPAAVAASGSGASSQAVAASAFPPDASPLAVSCCDGLPPAVVVAAAGVSPFAGFGPVVVAPLLAEFGHISVTASVSVGKGSSSFGRPMRREAPAASTHTPMLAAGAPETARPCACTCAGAGACIPLAVFAGAASLARGVVSEDAIAEAPSGEAVRASLRTASPILSRALPSACCVAHTIPPRNRRGHTPKEVFGKPAAPPGAALRAPRPPPCTFRRLSRHQTPALLRAPTAFAPHHSCSM